MQFWETAQVLDPPAIEDIYASPGHLIRRSHQISVSLFAEELGELGLTPVQYASLLAIRDRPNIDQRSLGRLIAIDRSTIGTLLKGLEKRGLIERHTPANDKRAKALIITPAGEALLNSTIEGIGRVQSRLLAPLTKQEQQSFLKLITKLVELNNDQSRAPLISEDNAK